MVDFSLNTIAFLLFLMLPIVISATLHMVIVKRNGFKSLAKPVHQKFFGKNKTWRGFLVMVLLTPFAFVGVTILGKNWFDLPKSHWPESIVQQLFAGVCLGLAYVLSELPNSFLKRRLGIPEGQGSAKYKILFTWLDQADSVIGCAFVYFLLVPASREFFWWLIIFAPLVHLLGNVVMYKLGFRKAAF